MAVDEVRTTVTPRQRDVIVRLRTGLTNKEIAADLGITEDGVKAHLGRLYLRYGVTNRVALLRAVDDENPVVHIAARTLGELRTMSGSARERTRKLGRADPSNDELAPVRDALAAVDIALDLLRELPPETTGPVLDALRKRVAKAISALDSIGGGGRPGTLGHGA